MTDHQRADSLGMVQAGIEVTPSLNRLAAQGAVFTRAYTTCPLCVPARTALATGKYPTKNGVVCNAWRGARAGDHVTLHECLADAGCAVARLGRHHICVEPGLRERLTFARWNDDGDYARFLDSKGVDWRGEHADGSFKREVIELQDGERVPVRYSNTRADVWPHPAEWFKDSYVCDQAIEFLREGPPRPFALFVLLRAPHPPLRVPEPYASLFDPMAIELPANVGQPPEGEPANRRAGIAAQLAEGVSMDEWRRVWAAHLGLVNLADAGIGRVLDALDAAGEADNTVVVFTSDHGDLLGQHAMYQKMEMHEPAIGVPLVFRVPGGAPCSWDVPVSQLDVMPTILELLDIDMPSDLDGISLARSLTDGAAPPERPVFSQYSGNPTFGDLRRAVVTRRFKYVYDPRDVPELYDLEGDPLETRNLAADPRYADVRDELHALCMDWHTTHGDWVKQWGFVEGIHKGARSC